MKHPFNKGSEEPMHLRDDEVGKPIWEIPEEGGDEHQEDDENDFEIHRVPPANEQVVYAPGFDIEQQREWEERKKEEAEREKKENPRGYWEM